MLEFFKTGSGKLIAFIIFYIPFLCAVFFKIFEGKVYESPIGGCCISMQGVVIGAYGIFTIWVVVPLTVIFFAYKLYKKFRK